MFYVLIDLSVDQLIMLTSNFFYHLFFFLCIQNLSLSPSLSFSLCLSLSLSLSLSLNSLSLHFLKGTLFYYLSHPPLSLSVSIFPLYLLPHTPSTPPHTHTHTYTLVTPPLSLSPPTTHTPSHPLVDTLSSSNPYN